jgi:murein DD-endopeptidase MepM/ murein hydrolase activator NlpD
MKTNIVNVTSRIALLLVVGLTLANCASVPRPDSPDYRPAPGTSFMVYVRPGDTLSEIAERYRVNEEDIVAMNGISDPDQILSGDQLYVPAYGVGRPPVDETPVRPAQRSAPRTQTQQASYQPPAATPRRAPRNPLPPTAADARFVWPVSGQVISNFGTAANGERNDGINIVAERGAPIHAAGAGTVTYVGNELRDFGHLLLIRHDNGYVTAYAHADNFNVERGQRIEEGQVVGTVGATGDVTQPQLHFEIRKGTEPVNPTAYLVRPRVNQASLTPSDPAKS